MANTDKFIKVTSNTGWTIGGSGVADASVTTIPLNAVTNIPTDTAVLVTVDRVDNSGTKTPSKMERFIGTVSGTNIINCIRGVEGTAQAHSAGAVVEINISATNINKLMEGLLIEHNQDGTHKASSMEWVTLAGTLTAATATTINTSVDLTSVIQKGDKLKLINSSSTKYFYVVSLTSTVITVTGEVDLVAGAITSPQYSKIANPQGFKVAMPYTPTLTGLTLGNGTMTAYITIIGNFVTVNITILCGSTTTFSSNNTISIPVTAIGVVNYSFLRSAIQRYIGSSIPGLLVSGGTNLQLASSTVIGSYIAEAVVTSTVPFTWGANDSISAIFTGRII